MGTLADIAGRGEKKRLGRVGVKDGVQKERERCGDGEGACVCFFFFYGGRGIQVHGRCLGAVCLLRLEEGTKRCKGMVIHI